MLYSFPHLLHPLILCHAPYQHGPAGPVSHTDLFLIQLKQFPAPDFNKIPPLKYYEAARAQRHCSTPTDLSFLMWNYKGFQLNKYTLINVHLSLHGWKKWSATLDLWTVPFWVMKVGGGIEGMGGQKRFAVGGRTPSNGLHARLDSENS